MYMYMYICIYIYIHIERERLIYIYIYMEREREMYVYKNMYIHILYIHSITCVSYYATVYYSVSGRRRRRRFQKFNGASK